MLAGHPQLVLNPQWAVFTEDPDLIKHVKGEKLRQTEHIKGILKLQHFMVGKLESSTRRPTVLCTLTSERTANMKIRSAHQNRSIKS